MLCAAFEKHGLHEAAAIIMQERCFLTACAILSHYRLRESLHLERRRNARTLVLFKLTVFSKRNQSISLINARVALCERFPLQLVWFEHRVAEFGLEPSRRPGIKLGRSGDQEAL